MEVSKQTIYLCDAYNVMLNLTMFLHWIILLGVLDTVVRLPPT